MKQIVNKRTGNKERKQVKLEIIGKKGMIEIALMAAILILIISSMAIFGTPKIGKFIVQEPGYAENVSLEYNQDSLYTHLFKHTPKSIRLSGELIGEGYAKVYLRINGTRKLIIEIYQGNITEEGPAIIGSAITYAGDWTNETIEDNMISEEQTQGINNPIDLSEEANESQMPVETEEGINQSVINETNGKNLTQENQAMANISQDKTIKFERECAETCVLKGMPKYAILEIEVRNATLRIYSIEHSYSVKEELGNRKPEFMAIPNLTWEQGTNITINLSEYSFDPDNDELTYLSSKPDNISVFIYNDLITLMPEEEWHGKDTIQFIASDMNESSISNESYLEVLPAEKELQQMPIRLGEPVKWTKRIKEEDINISEDNARIKVTKNARRIKIISDNETGQQAIEENISVSAIGGEITLQEYEKIKEKEEKETKIRLLEHKIKLKNKEAQLKNIKADTKEEEQGIIEIQEQIRELENATNMSASMNDTEIIIPSHLINGTKLMIIEYETPAPEAYEYIIDQNRKEITASSEEHYENITASTQLYREANAERLKLYWLNNGTREEVSVNKIDTNNNSLIDNIEWNIPHLSNQTYELVINIIKAEELDNNRTFVEDVYEYVKERDSLYREIKKDNYMRVTFVENLTSKKDITIYARSKKNARIDVYEKDSWMVIARFENVKEDGEYKVMLTNLTGEQDTFDLEIIDADIEFDYIVDPTGSIIINLTMPENNSMKTTRTILFNYTPNVMSGGTIQTCTIYGNFSGSWQANASSSSASSQSYSMDMHGLSLAGGNATGSTYEARTFMNYNPGGNATGSTYESNIGFFGDANVAGPQNNNYNLTSGIPIITNIDIPDGNGYIWNAKCNNSQGEEFWGESNYTFSVDATKPTIQLNSPQSGLNTNSSSISFNWTASDNLATSLTCNLTIDGTANQSNIGVVSGTPYNITIGGFAEGAYHWNVTCTDLANNENTSETRNFTVSFNIQPDTPTASLTSVTGTNKTDADLNCSSTITDPEGSNMNITVIWFKDDALNLSTDYNNNYANGAQFSAILDDGNTTKDDAWKCGIRLYDGESYSEFGNSSSLIILNSNPTITSVVVATPLNPVGGGVASAKANFTASDNDGYADLNDTSALANMTKDAITRQGSCTAQNINALSTKYACTIPIQYYDSPGTWNVNAIIFDNSRAIANDTSQPIIYNQLYSMTITKYYQDFGSQSPGAKNLSAVNGPQIINNTGNMNYSQINLTAFDLKNGAAVLGAANFTVNLTNSTTYTGQEAINNTPITISNSTLAVNTYKQMHLFLRLPNNLKAGLYNSSSPWILDAIG